VNCFSANWNRGRAGPWAPSRTMDPPPTGSRPQAKRTRGAFPPGPAGPSADSLRPGASSPSSPENRGSALGRASGNPAREPPGLGSREAPGGKGGLGGGIQGPTRPGVILPRDRWAARAGPRAPDPVRCCPSRTTSSRWLTCSNRRAAGKRWGDHLGQALAVGPVQEGADLVQQQNPGVLDQDRPQADQLLHASGKGARIPVEQVQQVQFPAPGSRSVQESPGGASAGSAGAGSIPPAPCRTAAGSGGPAAAVRSPAPATRRTGPDGHGPDGSRPLSRRNRLLLPQPLAPVNTVRPGLSR
jgi:hypothetical protein